MSRKTGDDQVNYWEGVLLRILLMAGVEVLNKGLRILAPGRRVEAGGQVSQEGALTLGVNRFSWFSMGGCGRTDQTRY